MKINLRIDRLVFEGVPLTAVQAASAGAAAERELSRLLGAEPHAERFFPAESVARMDAPHFAFTPTDTPRAIGTRIARAVHGALTERR